LVSSNPGRARKTIAFRVPGYKFKVKGTAQVSVDPGRSIRIVVFEGSMSVSLDSIAGEFQDLSAGQMLIVRPSDRRLPDAIEVDLQHLTATSALVRGAFGPLPVDAQIGSAIAAQSLDLRRGDLEDTRLIVRGTTNAIEVRRVRAEVRAVRAEVALLAGSDAQFFNAINDLNDPSAVVRERQYLYPSSILTADTLGDAHLVRDESNPGRSNTLLLELAPAKTFVPGSRPTITRAPRIIGDVTIDPDMFSGQPRTLRFLVRQRAPNFDRLGIMPGASVTTPTGVNLDFEATFGMDVAGATLTAGTGSSELLSLHTLEGGSTITSGSVLTGGTVTVKSGATNGGIVVNNSRITGRRDLRVGDTVPTPIRVLECG
jgi:hypothetical protein